MTDDDQGVPDPGQWRAEQPSDQFHAAHRGTPGHWRDRADRALGPDDAREIWEGVRGRLRGLVGEGPYETWLKRLSFVDLSEGQFTLAAPGGAARQIQETFGQDIQRLLTPKCPQMRRLRIISGPAAAEPASSPSAVPATPVPAPARGAADRAERADIGSRLDPDFTFARFEVGPSNEAAYRAAMCLADGNWQARGPLVIHGPSGFGKTHLATAFAHEALNRDPSLDVLYLPVEQFVYKFGSAALEARRAQNSERLTALKARMRMADILILDDFGFAEHREKSTVELFDTVRDVIDRGGRVLIVSDRPPLDLEGIDAKLRARLVAGLALDVRPADEALKRKVVQRLADEELSRRGVSFPAEVLDLLVRRIGPTIRELKGAFNKLQFYATDLKWDITMQTVDHVLSDMLRKTERRMTVDSLQRLTADYYGVSLPDLLGKKRNRHVVRARHVAMYLCRTLLHRSYPDLGRRFGSRDHSSILFGVRKIEKELPLDATVAEAVAALTERAGQMG